MTDTRLIVRHVVRASNILLDPPPSKITIRGTDFEVDSDFRTAIRFTQLMQDNTVDDFTKIDIALYMFLGDVSVPDLWAAVTELLSFYRCGKPAITDESDDPNPTAKRVYDFEYDAELIYAAFLEQYGIDLQTCGALHWWQFRALFSGLSDKTEFMKVVGYRSIPITANMSREEKRRYQKLKTLYALPDNRTEEEKESAFARSLMQL